MPRQVKQKEDENTVVVDEEEEEDKRGPWYHRVVWVIEKQIKLIPFLGLLSQQQSSGSVDTPSTIQHQLDGKYTARQRIYISMAKKKKKLTMVDIISKGIIIT